jgi:hypothetical protein
LQVLATAVTPDTFVVATRDVVRFPMQESGNAEQAGF